MTLETFLDEPVLFRVDDGEGWLRQLSVRERRMAFGALNFHSLMAPGRALTTHWYDGGWDRLPRTTDDATFTGMSRNFRRRIATVVIRSLVSAEDRVPTRGEATSLRLVDRDVRHLHVSEDAVLDFDPPRDISPDPVRRVLRAIRARAPLWYDEARDLELLRHRKPLIEAVERRDFEREFAPGGSHEDFDLVPAPGVAEGAPRAVLIGVHWFELGGAERWAFETVRLVREAGFLPIVLSNRDSHQPWLGRPELDGALVIPFSEPTVASQTPGVEELLRGLLRSFDVRGVVVHHNQWLYDRLHWIRSSRPGLPIVDSTHITEFRGGGFPASSARVDEAITIHHVISPTLGRWMTDVQRVDPSKVVVAPLGGLTVDATADPVYRERRPGERLTVAFVGRIARQKAPEVFVAMARRLQHRDDVRFVMHGDGELSSWLDEVIAAEGMTGRIERRTSQAPVAETLEETHLLVVPSHNEGLTLTTLEAIAHGIPVVSTDVGAQQDIIPTRALAPRRAHAAVRTLAAIVAGLLDDEEARRRLWVDERAAERKLLERKSASTWFTQEISTW